MSRTAVQVVFPGAHLRGGTERVTWDLLAYLAALQLEVTFLGSETPDGLPAGVGHIQVPVPQAMPTALRPVAFRRAAAGLTGDRTDVVRVSMGTECPPGEVLWVHSVHRAWLRLNAPVELGGRPVSGRIRWAMPRHLISLVMEHQYFRRARPRHVLCTSQAEKQLLADVYDIPDELVTVVPNGYDPQIFHPGRRSIERPRLRSATGAGDGDIVLLLVANELHRKGLAPLLRAMARVDAPFRLAVVGGADPQPFAALSDRLGLAGRVHHLGRTNDVAGVMSGADLLVLPTQYEPFGLVVVEALAAGLPVLTTRLAGAAMAVRPGITGLLQENPDDVEELAELLGIAARADLANWGNAAASSVDDYRKDRVMARAAAIILDGQAHDPAGGGA